MDPDTKGYFTVAPENIEFHRIKDKGWHVIGEPNDKEVELEAFPIAIANELIAATLQADGVEMVYEEEGSEENNGDNEC